MKLLSRRPIFTVSLFNGTTKTCFQIAHFSTNSPNQFQSYYPSRRHEEESRNVKVSVWWDFENCSPPVGVNVFKVAPSITAAIRANGIKGPIQITAFGDVLQLSRANQEALSSTGINITHIPNGGKNSADRSLLVDLMYWVSQNPPPAHLLLISGDRDFAGILHRLRMNNYNILLASPESAPTVLCSAASIMWQWNALLKGENLIGKHFNQPPDGPYGSWYGHYKAPLEDPFAVTEQPCVRPADLSESVADPKFRPIPKSILKQIGYILSSFPKGISITEFRGELAKSNLSIDKDFYGYKKFSRFLLAMPNILKLQSGSDGQCFVQSINLKVPEQSDLTSGTTVEPKTNGEIKLASTPTLNGERDRGMQGVGEMLLPPQSSDQKAKTSVRKLQGSQKVQDVPKKVQQPSPAKVQEPKTKMQVPPGKLQEPTLKLEVAPGEMQELSPNVENGVAKASGGQLQIAERHSSAAEIGFLKRLWNKWFGNKEIAYGENISNKKTETAETEVNLKSHSGKSVGPDSFAPGKDTNIKDEIPTQSEATVEEPSQESGLFNQIKNWCRVWRSSPEESGLGSHKQFKQTELSPEAHELFSKESFWKEMGSFLITSQGSVLVLQSRTRAQMTQNLQKAGRSFLHSFSEGDLLRLVDLLISEKKWVEERLTQTFPYKLCRPVVKASLGSSNSSSLNGLSSIFNDTKVSANSQSSQELGGEKRYQNPPHTGVSQPVIQGTSFGKSRGDVLMDCQKLVDYIVKEYPEGYNIGAFRKLFLERYGYSLDINKLGYTKVVNLLQIMTGIKIEANYIVPSSQVSKSSGPKQGDAEFDSPWEELGPISKTGPSMNEIEVGSNGKVKDESSEHIHDYEPALDGDFSDSDEETPSSTKLENGKSKMGDSSFLQVLDSFYSRKETSENVDGMVIASPSGSKSSADGMVVASTNGSKSSAKVSVDKREPSLIGRMQKPTKSYSFVSDQPGGDAHDKLIDNILGNLKKSGERSTESRI